MMPRQPKPFWLMRSSASCISVPSGASGSRSPACITSRTCARLAPSEPPGWNLRKSSAVKPRASRSAIASASPSASWISVEVVGARPCGQASSTRGRISATSAERASVELARDGDGDERHAEAARIEDDVAELRRLARPGERDITSSRRDHAEVAVARLGGMHEEGRRAGRGERRGDLGADMPALAHAGDDDAAGRRGDQRAAPASKAARISPRAPLPAPAGPPPRRGACGWRARDSETKRGCGERNATA